MRMEREERLDGAVIIERSELYIRLFWIRDVKDSERRSFKNALLKEFAGKLIIDFRRQGGTIVMNDMICILGDDVNINDLKEEIISAHARSARRTGSVDHISGAIFQLFDAESLKGKLTISVYEDQRKIMAQAKPDTLKHFIKLFGNAVNKLNGGSVFTRQQVLSASQEWSTDTDEFLASQEQTDSDDVTCDNFSNDVTERPVISSPNESVQPSAVDSSTTDPLPDKTNSGASEISRLSRIEKAVYETSEIIKQSTFTNFQSSVMAELRDVKEDLKGILLDIPILRGLKGKFDALEIKVKTELADLNAEVLIQKEEINKLKTSLDDAHKNNRAHKSTANAMAVSVCKLTDELSNVRHEIAGGPPAMKVGDFEGLSSSFDTLRADLAAFQAKHEYDMETMRAQQVPVPAEQALLVEPTPTSEERTSPRHSQHKPEDYVFDCEILYVHDSNGVAVRADILQHNAITQKVLAYTIPEAIAIIERATFASIPRKIVLDLGTNDVEYDKSPAIGWMYERLLTILQARCEGAQIFFSAVKVRQNRMDTVRELNDILIRLTSQRGCHLIEHSNIKPEMLRDKKHLNKTGFYLYLANIRFKMFGKKSKILTMFT